MGKIFCLETEWKQNVHDLKEKSSILPLLEFLKTSRRVDFTFRNVATISDFTYYVNHLYNDTYNRYDIIYLCFHGIPSKIELANGETLDLIDFAEKNKGIFKGKNVHFGSCSTLNMSEEDIKYFKRETGARMITGYQTSIEFVTSFIFELWLLNEILDHPHYAQKRLLDLVETRMPYWGDIFKFVAY
ncbi:MAG: hypothetical protein IJ417_00370 [Bacteroidaceae bacterium]|nr:hypothetical protein [Bacteroidaceae bacterium]